MAPPRGRKRKGSDDEEEMATSKRSKGAASLKPEKKEDGEGNAFWELSGKRRVTISEFKNMTLISLREYYEKDGKSLPGKGISLKSEQLEALILALPEITAELEKQGISLPRPDYTGVGSKVDDDDEEESTMEKKPKKKEVKKNIDATSDEDSDD